MSKRLQVLIEEKEYSQFKKLASKASMSLGEWVRQALRQAASSVAKHSSKQKLEALDRAFEYNFPSGDIEQILEEINMNRTTLPE